jgi:hypothetical protein
MYGAPTRPSSLGLLIYSGSRSSGGVGAGEIGGGALSGGGGLGEKCGRSTGDMLSVGGLHASALWTFEQMHLHFLQIRPLIRYYF